MKRKISSIIILFFLISVIGCSSPNCKAISKPITIKKNEPS